MPDSTLEAMEKPFCEVGDEKNHASPNNPPMYSSPSSESSEGHQSQIIHYISTTTESMFMISLIERLKKIMGSCMWGQLLGSSSFGTVYEGINDDGNEELNALGHPHHKVLHPSSNSCIFRHHQDPLTLAPCKQCDSWNYTPQKFLEVVGTYCFLKAVGASLPAKLLEELKKIHEFYLQSPFCANKDSPYLCDQVLLALCGAKFTRRQFIVLKLINFSS
ncbi:hypothetical protein M5K25_008979 [Dendrobium thyrsiflorum]|uniref:Uncharacterized protein n=1 Tax=Dendrobium thyrsiflorum TaxID=117978 RepID=A0ABD0VA50_DENTH